MALSQVEEDTCQCENFGTPLKVHVQLFGLIVRASRKGRSQDGSFRIIPSDASILYCGSLEILVQLQV